MLGRRAGRARCQVPERLVAPIRQLVMAPVQTLEGRSKRAGLTRSAGWLCSVRYGSVLRRSVSRFAESLRVVDLSDSDRRHDDFTRSNSSAVRLEPPTTGRLGHRATGPPGDGPPGDGATGLRAASAHGCGGKTKQCAGYVSPVLGIDRSTSSLDFSRRPLR